MRRWLKVSLIAALPAAIVGGFAWADNYQATQGSGTTFGSHIVGGVHYAQSLLCDAGLGTRCVGVDTTSSLLVNPGVAANWGVGNTGSAVPAAAEYIAINSGGNLVGWNGAVTVTTGTVSAIQQGTWNQRLQDGSGNAITSDARGGERPLSVQIMDAGGNQVTTFGGSGGTASNFNAAFPSQGTAIGMSQGVSMVALNGTGGALEVCIWNGAACSGLNSNGPAAPGSSAPVILPILNHASATTLSTSLITKAGPGDLVSYNCTGVSGGVAGYCIAYNAVTTPATGALTGSLVQDFCYFDATPTGCSLAHMGGSISYTTGVVILVTTASSPYTFTQAPSATAAISADFY